MKSSFCLPVLAAFFAAVKAAPNGPWPTNNPWASAWQGGDSPSSWPVPSWAKPCYSPTATATTFASPSNSPVTSAAATASISSSASMSVLVAGSATATGSTGAAPTAVIINGTVIGLKAYGYNQDYFLGVPYAQPPINDLRFRVPQSINSSFAGPYSATQISPECIGYGSDQWPYAISEDCLYLNIIRPSNYSAYKEPLPVAFWIHGGGFTEGGNADQRYNMSVIVQNGVEIGRPFIAVQINYRLSAWGFMYGDQIAGEGSTNIGLRDQRLGLHWVQENIAAFGGDPKQVTIWGESAGAASVGFQLVAYGGRNDSLIARGIMESGNSVPYSPLRGSDSYQPRYNAIVNATGCSDAVDSLQCLRSLPFNSLNAAINSSTASSWFPVVDGDFIRRYPSLQLAAGEFLKVPIIDGANSDEGISFGPRGYNTSAQFVAGLESGAISPTIPLPSTLSQELAATYLALNICDTPPLTLNTVNTCPPAPASSGAIYRFTSAYAGDAVFIANRRLQCQTWAAAGLDAFCYRFNAQPAGNTIYSGVPHFQEIGFVFDNIAGIGYAPAAVNPFLGKPPSFTALAKYMSSSWASFINCGDPNGWLGQDATGTPDWPVYSVSAPENIVWDANVTALAYAEPDTFRAAGIALINSANVAYQR